MIRAPWRRDHRVEQLSADTDTRLQEAQSALGKTEQQVSKADEQVSFLQGLRGRWAEVHRQNHLAEIFARDGGLG